MSIKSGKTGGGSKYKVGEIFDPLRIFHNAEADELTAEEKLNNQRWAGIGAKAETLAGQGPDSATTTGWNMTLDAANDPENNRLLSGSRDYNNRILSGEFLDPDKNLALAAQLQRGYEGIGGWDATAEASGRYGSGAWAEGRGREMADLKANLYGQGLDRMERASSNAGNIYAQQFAPGQMIGAVGQERTDFGWNQLNNQANLLGAQRTGTVGPTYSGNKVMGGIGAAISIIGAVKGMGGSGDKTAKTNTPKSYTMAGDYGNQG